MLNINKYSYCNLDIISYVSTKSFKKNFDNYSCNSNNSRTVILPYCKSYLCLYDLEIPIFERISNYDNYHNNYYNNYHNNYYNNYHNKYYSNYSNNYPFFYNLQSPDLKYYSNRESQILFSPLCNSYLPLYNLVSPVFKQVQNLNNYHNNYYGNDLFSCNLQSSDSKSHSYKTSQILSLKNYFFSWLFHLDLQKFQESVSKEL